MGRVKIFLYIFPFNFQLIFSLIYFKRRFIALTKTKFFYWYQEQEHKNNKMPLGYFELKEINTVDILPEYKIGGKQNVIKISVSSFYKKNKKKGERSFYFSPNEKSKLYEWVISLNFLRVKAIYDEFKTSFGVITLPMNNDNKSSNKKQVKMKLKMIEEGKKKKNNNSLSSFFRKSMISNSVVNILNRSTGSNKQINSNSASFAQIDAADETEQIEKVDKVKDMISFIWIYGILSLTGNIQRKIFDSSDKNNSNNEQRILPIPDNLIGNLENLAVEEAERLKNEKQ